MQAELLQPGTTVSGGKKCRSALFLCFCFLPLLLAALSALTAGNCFNLNPESPKNRPSVLLYEESNGSLRNTDRGLFAEPNTYPRFSVSRVVQRLLLRPNNQYRTQNYKTSFALLLTGQSMRSNLILGICAFRYSAFAALSHFRIILKTVLPVRAGPSGLTAGSVALSF